MVRKTLFGFFALLLTLTMYSCSDLNFHLPPGPKGEDGKSVYEIWKEQVGLGKVQWPKDRVSMADFLIYIKGEKGDKGENGKSAYELWKELISKGNTPNPHNPSETWPSERNTEADFWDFITGRDGNTPHVGENGNWWIGNKDTGVLARGKNGIDGKNGLSAYELWKQEVLAGRIDWPKDKVELSHFFQYLKGKDGKDGRDGVTPHIGPNGNWWFGDTDTGVPAKGKDGKDGVAGVTPHIGENGNWWIGDTDTGVPAKGKDGKDGKDGVSPHIGENGNWWIGNTDTGVPAKGKDGKDGKDGVTPHIGENGNWWIGDTDTGVPAKGKDGENGLNGVSPHIGENGNWWIGDIDTRVPAQGKKGNDGINGLNAYQLWVKDLKAGKITDPETGNPWPKNQDTLADFWRYLRGAKGDKGDKGKDGKDGLSAYEVWKQMVLKDQIKDPNDPSQNWPKTKVEENHFWEFLTGKNGQDGLSAYELWKKELEDRFNTANPLMNYQTGEKWPKDKDSKDDFFDFLRGKDGKNGKDGEDGKPGEPGAPGAELTIILGVPNVIAQYTQSSHGEYVSTIDGSVTYRVHDKEGRPAPNAKVKGLPGILDPNKTYTANADGYFTVPKEDLPSIQDIKERFGKVKSVKIQGESEVESAPNTYVPNRMKLRLVLHDVKSPKIEDRPFLNGGHNLSFRIQRQTGPGMAWTDLPTYLPKVTDIYIASYQATNNMPNSITATELDFAKRTADIIHLRTKRFAKKNKANFKNDAKSYWDGQTNYFTVKLKNSYYGETPQWNGICEMAPYQISPLIKDLTLTKVQNAINNTDKFFKKVSGTFTFDDVDFKMFYEKEMEYQKDGEIDRIIPKKMTEEAARKVKESFAYFYYKTFAGEQIADSRTKLSGDAQKTFVASTVYLGSQVRVKVTNGNTHLYPGELVVGNIIDGSAGYKLVNNENPALVSGVTVKYEDN